VFHVATVATLGCLKKESYYLTHPKPYKLHWLNEACECQVFHGEL